MASKRSTLRNLVSLSLSLERLKDVGRSERAKDSSSSSGDSSPSMTREKGLETLN